MTYVQERPPAGGVFAMTPDIFSADAQNAAALQHPASAFDDTVSQWLPAPQSPQPAPAGLWDALQQLFGMLSQLFGQNGFTGSSAPGEQFFNDAQAASVGDPHLSFSGTTAGGSEQTQFDSMTGHGDLLSSDSFIGGYRLSTQATAPSANGITYNQSATVTTNFGSTSITLNKDGTATLMQGSQATQIAEGQRVPLGNGAFVQRGQDGSLRIVDRNRQGGSIETTMRLNGQGVDVSVRAHRVDLSGDLPQTAQLQPGSWL
ncbi:MAG TPA: hypothetical protein VFL13_10180 [Candidatus Baltobacteraceae bacterium]|nr:hypothetical protein [Candidatus Baltobacteraceae bacterium]